MARVKREQIVDTDTGEVLFARNKSLSMYLFHPEKGYMLFHNRLQVKRFVTMEWPEGLTNLELGLIMRLVPHICTANRIANEKGALTAAQIAQALGQSKSRTYRFLKRLIALGMMARTPQGYFMNPMYLLAGKYVSAELYGLFKDKLNPYLPNWVKEGFGEGR